MREKILITSLLYEVSTINNRYYYAKTDDGKILYCNALMSTEASCKFILSRDKLDDIIIIGSESVVRPEDKPEPVALGEGRSLFESDLKDLSAYDLLRFRIAEYMEGQHRSDQIDAALSDEEKESVISFLNSFFEDKVQNRSGKEPDHYFHLLAQDKDMQEDFDEALQAWAPTSDLERYKSWALSYLYDELNDTYKMEPREDNTDIRIMLATLKEDESIEFPKYIMNTMDDADDTKAADGTDIYLCIQNTEASMILDIYNLINMTRVFPGNEVNISKTISTKGKSDVFANEILDVTKLQSMSELFSGVEAFLKYGKTDIIVQYWNQANIENPLIDRIMYAMRNIDNGISLCDISDIERGINSLRKIIRSDETFEGYSPIEEALAILLEGVRRDYGRLLETDRIEFIDLVKWAYRKEFWQQTLTLIESRAPRDFVKKGFYFYCDSEENRDKDLSIFGHIYNDLKPYERYKLEDVSHYYLKFYNRIKTGRSKRCKDRMHEFADIRIEELDTTDSREIRACTICPDRTALAELLFAYYYVGNTRNSTNHAIDTSNGTSEIDESDDSKRMETIRECIEYFIQCYENVARLVEGKEPNVITVTYEDVKEYARKLFDQERRKRYNKNRYDKKD